MPRQVKVPKSVAAGIGQLGLSRELINDLLNVIHLRIRHGWPDDDRCFSFQVTISKYNERHFFVLIVDDTTSADHLIVEQIGHARFDDDDDD